MRELTASLLVLLTAPALHAQGVSAGTVPAAVAADVRRFAQEVAAGISREGPTAWQRYFEDGPQFFMAVNGRLQFADGAAAQRGIAALPQMIRRITLTFGADLRVDPLGADLAMLASSYTEVLVSPKGDISTDRGFFSALAERRQGLWRLRNAHWSSLAPVH
jgi:hypothetical protein